jgi:hypothetical protein
MKLRRSRILYHRTVTHRRQVYCGFHRFKNHLRPFPGRQTELRVGRDRRRRRNRIRTRWRQNILLFRLNLTDAQHRFHFLPDVVPGVQGSVLHGGGREISRVSQRRHHFLGILRDDVEHHVLALGGGRRRGQQFDSGAGIRLGHDVPRG